MEREHERRVAEELSQILGYKLLHVDQRAWDYESPHGTRRFELMQVHKDPCLNRTRLRTMLSQAQMKFMGTISKDQHYFPVADSPWPGESWELTALPSLRKVCLREVSEILEVVRACGGYSTNVSYEQRTEVYEKGYKRVLMYFSDCSQVSLVLGPEVGGISAVGDVHRLFSTQGVKKHIAKLSEDLSAECNLVLEVTFDSAPALHTHYDWLNGPGPKLPCPKQYLRGIQVLWIVPHRLDGGSPHCLRWEEKTGWQRLPLHSPN